MGDNETMVAVGEETELDFERESSTVDLRDLFRRQREQEKRRRRHQKVEKQPRDSPKVDLSVFRWLGSRLPGEHHKRRIVDIETDWNDAWEEMKEWLGEFPVVGWDLEGVSLTNYHRAMWEERAEWVDLPEIVHDNILAGRPVLMQLATLSGFVILVRLGHFSRIPGSLRRLLASQDIYKVGVNIQSDATWMFERWGATVNGWVDLRSVVREAEAKVPKEVTVTNRLGLKQLALAFFGDLRIKTESLKMVSYSNWAKYDLSWIQLYYATFDAQVAVDICGVILSKMMKGLSFSADGKTVQNGMKKSCLAVLERNIHRGYSRQEVPMQALKLEDIHSPNSSMEEKSFKFRTYMFDMCDEMQERRYSVVEGLERTMRCQLRKEEGRIPKALRLAGNSRKVGYLTSSLDRLQQDRIDMLPAHKDRRHPPGYWLQTPKLSVEVGMKPEKRYSQLWLSDAIHSDMDWVLEMEVVTMESRRLLYDDPKGWESLEFDQSSTAANGDFSGSDRSTESWEISEEIDDGGGACGGEEGQAAAIKGTEGSDGTIWKEEGDDDADTDSDEEIESYLERGWKLEGLSMQPCWVCGKRSVEALCWEPIVPESIVCHYSSRVHAPCLCNWARLCVHCVTEWRCAQHEVMMEWGLLLDSSLDDPKFTTLNSDRKSRVALLKLMRLERAQAKKKWWLEDLQGEVEQQRQALRSVRGGSQSVDVKELWELTETNWYRRSKRSPFEKKALETCDWDVVAVEKAFRARLQALSQAVSQSFFLPRSFSLSHACMEGKVWSPPAVLSKKEVQELLSRPGIHCDLDAAMEGFVGGLDDSCAEGAINSKPSNARNERELKGDTQRSRGRNPNARGNRNRETSRRTVQSSSQFAAPKPTKSAARFGPEYGQNATQRTSGNWMSYTAPGSNVTEHYKLPMMRTEQPTVFQQITMMPRGQNGSGKREMKPQAPPYWRATDQPVGTTRPQWRDAGNGPCPVERSGRRYSPRTFVPSFFSAHHSVSGPSPGLNFNTSPKRRGGGKPQSSCRPFVPPRLSRTHQAQP